MTDRPTSPEPDPTAAPDNSAADSASDSLSNDAAGSQSATPDTDATDADAATSETASSDATNADTATGDAAGDRASSGSTSPEIDEIEALKAAGNDAPHEPSKYDLDAPKAPELDDSANDATAPADPVTYAPKRTAAIMLGLLAIVMATLGVVGLQQSGQEIYDSFNPAQVQAMASLLEKSEIRTYTADEIDAVKKVWATEDHPKPTNEEIAAAFNQGTNASGDDVLTAQDVEKAFNEANGNLDLPSVESLDNNLRTQSIVYGVSFLIAAISAVFYLLGKPWARLTGMFISGVVALMWGMQAIQSGFVPLMLIIAVIGGAAFYYLLKGRLTPAPASAGTGLGLSSFWMPRRPKRED